MEVTADRNKKSCSEPHRVHGSLLFRDLEPIKEGDKRYDDDIKQQSSATPLISLFPSFLLFVIVYCSPFLLLLDRSGSLMALR